MVVVSKMMVIVKDIAAKLIAVDIKRLIVIATAIVIVIIVLELLIAPS